MLITHPSRRVPLHNVRTPDDGRRDAHDARHDVSHAYGVHQLLNRGGYNVTVLYALKRQQRLAYVPLQAALG